MGGDIPPDQQTPKDAPKKSITETPQVEASPKAQRRTESRQTPEPRRERKVPEKSVDQEAGVKSRNAAYIRDNGILHAIEYIENNKFL